MPQCQECKKTHQRSRAQVIDSWTEYEEDSPATVKTIHDDDGIHFHDVNVYHTAFLCTSGHEWIESLKPGCKVCETLDETLVMELKL